MSRKSKPKVAIYFSITEEEETPEIQDDISGEELGFETYFDIDQTTHLEEFKEIARCLNRNGFNAYILNLHNSVHTLISNLEKAKPDVIFNFVEEFHNNPRLEMNICALYELFGVPYTGAPPLALAACQNKVYTKRILDTYEIKTPKFKLIRQIKPKYSHHLKFPIIVKPPYEDASSGIENESIVRTNAELKERIEYVIEEFQQPALIEEYIEGRELNVSVFGDKELKVLPISEIDFSEVPDHIENIVSYSAKWDPLHEAYHKTIPVCPAPLTKRVQKKVEKIALASFRAMGVRDYARIDMRLAKDNSVYVLEVNPNPDIAEGVAFMRSSETAGYSYEEMLVNIVNFALNRSTVYKR
ncbi:MAG: D-alanine--D-alanine ligase [Ignavibacteriae bacterium HGW-Ignavibacteriae-3]|nr:MAG: D-alanine--D-alanine ligase [Ignavibacteriae bacterium HGW-Ignavibacteriae-3]